MLSREETFWTPTGSVRALTTGIYGPAGPCATGRTQPAVSGWLTHASQGIKRFHDVPCMCPSLSMPIYIWLNLSFRQQRARSSVLLLSFKQHSWVKLLLFACLDQTEVGHLEKAALRLQKSAFHQIAQKKCCAKMCQKHLKHRALPKLKCLYQTKSLEGKWDAMTANMETARYASHSLQGWMLLVEQKPPGFHVQHFPAHYNAFLSVGCPQLPNSTASLRILVAILRSSNTPALFTVKHSHKNMRVQNTSKTLLVVPNSQWSIWRVGTCSSCEWSTACTTWARMRIPSGPSCTCHHHQIRWHEPWAYLLRHILSKSFDRTLRCPEQTTYSFISHHTSIWKHSREVQVRMCERANVACEPAAPARLLAWAKRPQDTDQTTPSTLNSKTWALEMVPTNYLKQCWKNACWS